ncbi:type III secretion system chaperone [Paracidovorax konjaci]|uniref:Tir chaperone protein (CesT) family protein n=1 Tax=Paracidovorax konjaci TaxID=32040 RepID=A0A1I1SLA0_9BURK|nr:type III secretion system chaperone [Paracidovorax konjaci]SFD45458.1 Tir chaperone protein (CesT) family protein [Paracidovorax konjaci]
MDTSATHPEPPSYSPASAAWLHEAALGFTEPETAASFARAVPIQQDGIAISPLLVQDQPEERWALVASLPRPIGVSEPVWTTLLLHLNAAAMGIGPLGIGMEATGKAMVVYGVPGAHTGDAAGLARDLFQLSYFSGLLRESAMAVQGHLPEMLDAHARRQADPQGSPPAGDADGMAPLPAGMAAAVQSHIDADWHQPLLEQAYEELGVASADRQGPALSDSVRIGTAQVQIVACGDGHTLLLSALVDRPLADGTTRLAALQANVELMLIAGCSLSLTPEGTLLQTRWDAAGLDGADLATQLDGFAALAASMDASTAAAPASVH